MAKEFIIFRVSGREYGIDVSGVNGIENYVEPTPISNAPIYISGVVNIRNEIFPVLDLKFKFHLPATAQTEETKYLLLKTNAGPLACIVDEVVEMHLAKNEEIMGFPLILRSEGTSYADSIVRAKERLVIMIDVNHIFDDEEAKTVASINKG